MGILDLRGKEKKPYKLIYNSAMCFLDTCTLKFWIKFYARQH